MIHTIRATDGTTIDVADYTRGKAIKLFCSECLGWATHSKECENTTCPLFVFRGQCRLASHSVAAVARVQKQTARPGHFAPNA